MREGSVSRDLESMLTSRCMSDSLSSANARRAVSMSPTRRSFSFAWQWSGPTYGAASLPVLVMALGRQGRRSKSWRVGEPNGPGCGFAGLSTNDGPLAQIDGSGLDLKRKRQSSFSLDEARMRVRIRLGEEMNKGLIGLKRSFRLTRPGWWRTAL